eukprot:NODE_789_length_4227_cov_0.325824.p3 type:complete len:100 gc:universal NODE_789_length_4227_cov_0.325824:1582-1881(+)
MQVQPIKACLVSTFWIDIIQKLQIYSSRAIFETSQMELLIRILFSSDCLYIGPTVIRKLKMLNENPKTFVAIKYQFNCTIPYSDQLKQFKAQKMLGKVL